MQKIIPAFFWLLFFIFIFSNLPGFLEYDVPEYEPDAGVVEAESFSPVQRALLELHNARRSAKGMKPLVLNRGLCDYAQKHAKIMAERGRMFHSSMERLQEDCGADVVGENVAWGQETEEEVVSSWMWSPMHRWNILGSSYSKVGFGVEKGEDGRNYWCVVFSS